MRTLTHEEIEKLANQKGVKSNAAYGFLSTMGDNGMYAGMNLNQDARDYRWNAATIKAIRDGIRLAGG